MKITTLIHANHFGPRRSFFSAQVGLAFVLALAGAAICSGQDVSLSLSSGSASPGATVTLNISLSASTTPPASLEWTLSYSTVDFSSATVAAGPVATAANKSVTCASSSGILRCIVSGLNDTTIPNGIVATISLTVSTSTTDLVSQVTLMSDMAVGAGATALAIASSNGVVNILPGPALNGFSCTPTAVSPAAGSTCTIALTSAAASGGAVINLSSSPADLNIPSTVTVPQGSSTTTFGATAGSVTTPTSVTLTAAYSGATETFNLTVNPPPAALSGLSVSPSTIVGGQSGTGTVSLTGVAPAGGAIVTLASSSSSAAGVPATVTIAAGASSATFAVTTSSVNAATPVTLTASYASLSMTAALTVNPVAAAVLNAISVSPSTIVSGQSGSGTVNLSGPAGAGGAVVILSSSNPAVASAPVSVTVPQGATSVTFTLTTDSIAAATSVTLTAAYAGVSKTVAVTINPAPAALSGVSVSPSTISNGQSSTGTVSLTAAAGAGGAVITLSTSNSTAASVATSVTVPQNSTSATFTVTGGNVSATTSVTVIASYAGSTVTTSVTINPPVVALSSISVNPATIIGGQTATGTVTLTSPAGVGGVAISLSSSNAAASVPITATVAQGATSATFSVPTQSVTTAISVTLGASYNGTAKTVTLAVNPPAAGLSGITVNPNSIAAGLSATGTVTLTAPASSNGIVVKLASSNSAAASVPATMTVPQGSMSATFPVSAGMVNATTSVVLSSSYSGVSMTTSLTVTAPASQPTAPGSLTAVNMSGGQVNLSWTASSDTAAVTNYLVERCLGAGCTSFSQIATSAVTSYTDTTVVANTTYQYRVRATDAAGHLSAYSNVASVTIPALNPPAALSSISVNSATIVGGQPGTGTVTLTSAAGSGGAMVALSSSNASAANVPASVTVPQGATSATFSITTGNVTAATSVTFTATYASVSKTVGLTVTVNGSGAPSAISEDAIVSVDAKNKMTTPTFSTSQPDLLVAFVGYDGPTSSPQTATVTGAGLTWTLLTRSNSQAGTSEIWAAQSPNLLSGVTVSSTPGTSGYHGSMTVIAFSNTSGAGMVNAASAASGAPDVVLSGVSAGNWVFAVGHDWDNAIARVPVTGQVLVHQRIDTQTGDTYWVQSTAVPSLVNGTVDIHDSSPTNDRWTYAAVEIIAANQ